MKESISVSALNQYTKQLIEGDEVLSQVWVEGELSGIQIHQQTGHIYFTLKDSLAAVRAVMFCTYAASLRFVPKDGMYAVVKCKVSFYEKSGSFQLTVFDLLPKGTGSAQRQLEETRQRLSADGLLAQERKRALPPAPKRIGLITSGSGAALQDILSIAESRDPTAEILLYNCSVQGVYAVQSIVRAIQAICRHSVVDLVIITRGGGSKEDLWYFNDETLVRAAALLPVPWISAVGHESDVTLLDAVSDLRAETPTAAAVLATQNRHQQYQDMRQHISDMNRTVSNRLDDFSKQVGFSEERLADGTNRMLDLKETALLQLADRCRSLDPIQVLSRGFARVRKQGIGVVSIRQIAENDPVQVLFQDGQADCIVERTGGAKT